MRALITFMLVACLALLGARADEAAAANYRPPRAPTEWSVISTNHSLSQLAGIMQRLGLQATLSRPFSGTLLLPTNDAIDEYMAQVELLHQRNGIFADPATEQRMWSNLLAGVPSAARRYKHAPEGHGRHTQHRAPGRSVPFASKNTAVLGGGLIHTVNSVLQPNDVYPSLAALLAGDPELSIWAAVIKEVASQTACWEGPWQFQTCDLEGIAGTFSLPTNGGFKAEDWGPANSDGVPININAAFWKPIVQFHFIRAKSLNDFVDYKRNRGFPANNKRTNLLGSLKDDDTDSYTLEFQAAGFQLSVEHRSPRGPAQTSITQPTIHIPPHIAHKVSNVMKPPCDTTYNPRT
uniref:FAS1 domain-containing protein n=1 Tax=Tetradesmus obliquus TaxID=3088 RepID=A0A383VCG1_TETOB